MKKALLIALIGTIVTIQMTSQGYILTQQSVGEVGVGSAKGQDVVCDNEGNTYVVGNFYNTVYFGDSVVSGNFGVMYVVKYDQLGNTKWVRQINGNSNNEAYGIAIDNEQNIYICGRYTHTNDYTILDFGTIQASGNHSLSTFLAMIDKEGNWQWVNTILAGDPVGQQICSPDEILVTHEGDVFLSGSINTSVTIDGDLYNSDNEGVAGYYFARFSSEGDLVWFKSNKGPFTGIEMALGTDGRVYFAGTASSTINFADDSITGPGSDDVLFGAISQDGELLWWQSAGHPSFDERPKGISLDQDDNIYLTFSNLFWVKIDDLTLDYDGVADQYLYKFNNQGSYLWMQPLYAGSVNGVNGIRSIDILAEPNGMTYVTGMMESPAFFGNPLFFSDTIGGFGYKECYLAAYQQNGSFADVTEFRFDEDFDAGEFVPSHMVFDHDHNITLVGTFKEIMVVGDDTLKSGPLNQMFLCKADPSELFDYSSGIIENIQNQVNVAVFPNPVKDLLTINTKLPGILNTEIMSLNGKLIFSEELEGPTFQIDLSSCQKGVFFITIKSKGFTTTSKIIKL